MQNFYLLHQEELIILAALFDMEYVYGLVGEKNEEEVPYRIHQMVRNGVLYTQEESIYVAEPYKYMLQSMKAASSILKLVSAEGQIIWFYLGSNIVEIEESQTDKKTLRISNMTIEEVLFLLAERFLPEEYLNSELSGIETKEEVYGALEEAQVYLLFELINTGVRQEELTIKVIQSRHNLWVVRYDGMGIVVDMKPYKKESLLDTVRKIMDKEGKNDIG